jgi:cell division septation protein DedD
MNNLSKFYVLTTGAVLIATVGCQSNSVDGYFGDNANASSNNSNAGAADLGSGEPSDLPCLSTTASVVGFSNTTMQFSLNAQVNGSVVLFGKSTLALSENATVVNQVYTSDSSNVTKAGLAKVGSIVNLDLTENEPSVLAFAQTAEQLAPTQTFDKIAIAGMNDSMTIQGNGGANVISVANGISLSYNESLILNGTKNDSFVFVIENGGINVTLNANIKTTGGLPAQNVLFMIIGKNPVNLAGNGFVAGTFMATESSASISGNGQIEGSVFATDSITITGNGLSFSPAPWCPSGPTPPPTSSPTPTPSPSSSPSSAPTTGPTTGPTSSPTPTGTPSGTPTGVSSSPSPSPTPTPSPSSSECTGPLCGGGIVGV